VVVLICKVEFKLKGVIEEKRSGEFMVGWLPLPIDLSLKENRIDLAMVNDLDFPTSMCSLLGVQSFLSATFTHPLHKQYKSKHDDKKVYAETLLTDTFNVSSSEKYVKLKSRKVITDSIS
jgi:hypothetical protein